MKSLLSLLLLPLVGSTGCTLSQPTVAYDCDCIDARFVRETEQTARLTVWGETFVLEKSMTATGQKFSAGGYSFWIQGDKAVLETPDEIYPDCRVRPTPEE